MERAAWLAAAMLVGVAGCQAVSSDDPVIPKPTAGAPEYFDVTWHNEAWGYFLSGWFVNSEGDVYRFDHSAERWNADADTVATADLLEKYSRGRQLVGHVAAKELAEMAALVPMAAAGELLARVATGCADFGVITYQAWRRLPERAAYARVLIHKRGDLGSRNSAPAAATLRAWLDGVTGLADTGQCEP